MTAAPSTGRVVVAVHDSPAGERAVVRGVAEARARRCALHLVRVWREVDLLYSMTRQEAARLARSERVNKLMLERAAWRAQQLDPHLTVTTELLPGDLYEALTGVAKTAELIVIGAAEPGSPDDIADWLPRHAGCPVIVVEPAPVGPG